MKTALVHDWLVTPGGSESVLEALYERYPGPIHTLIKDNSFLATTSLAGAEIRASFIQRLPWARTGFRNYLPLFPLAIEQFDLSGYDMVISSSHAVAKGVLTHEGQLHICYCHTPMRYAWGMYHMYLQGSGMNRLKKAMAGWALHRLRMWDALSASRVDHFVANSRHVAKKIKKIYGRDADVVYPPVDIDRFELVPDKKDYYLAASRLVGYKKIDVIVQAFARMPGKRLVVIGDGPERKVIERCATPNIEMLGYQENHVLEKYLQNARALVFAAEEDFGIVPVEAQACGTPVIAYARGGALETIVEGVTGLFFSAQTPEAIIEAIDRFEHQKKDLDPARIRAHAEKFGRDRFFEEFSAIVEKDKRLFRGQD
jgi:glycosyltransferase involved in cell wall biosynthesis